jgi:hypothetical protein
MTTQIPVIKNDPNGATFYVALVSQATPSTFQANPTLAAGDVKISIDGGAFNNLATLPVVTPAAGKAVKCVFSQAETNGDNLVVVFSDAAGAEWCDQIIAIQTGGTSPSIGRGTVAAGSSTTSLPTSSFQPAGGVANQFVGRVVLFDSDTTTAALRGASSPISASSNAAAPTFTVAALPAAPATGDKFSVI